MTVTTAVDIRQHNKERLRCAIRQHDRCTKSDIARATGLSMATCSTALNEMMDEGEILKIAQTECSLGRPADIFTYNPDYLHVLALCASIRNGMRVLEYAVADAFGRLILRRLRMANKLELPLLLDVIAECRAKDPKICVVSLGVPGHTHDGRIETCDLEELSHLDIADSIRAVHPVRVIVENDMNLIAYRLYRMSGEKKADCAALYFPVEENAVIGGGFVANGRLLRGKSMFAGELSAMAQAFGLSRTAQRALLHDREAFRVFVTQMVVSVICMLNPDQVTLMGNGLDESDLDAIREGCLRFVAADNLPELQINNNIADSYIEGIVQCALDTMLFPIPL